MPSFSSSFTALSASVAAIVDRTVCPSATRTGELLSRSRSGVLTLPELAELLEIGRTDGADEQWQALRAHAVESWRRPQDNVARYVAPIYVSSFCVDTCAYCNFSALRKATARKRLSVEELDAEIQEVMQSGARVIELVYGSDPEVTTDVLVRHVGRVVEALKGVPGAGVLLCTEYLPRETYRELKDAGLWGIVQWDETLDTEAYQYWHASSPHKRELLPRMDNHDRAMSVGLEVATGALFGLSDYRYDALMQVAKARHLLAEYGRAPFVFGTARLKPIAGHAIRLKTEVTDRAYETALMVYQLAMPQVGRWLQTRETFDMNLRNLLNGDVFTHRCGDVKPGGYQNSRDLVAVTKGGQFGVNELDLPQVERDLAARAFHLDFAWIRA